MPESFNFLWTILKEIEYLLKHNVDKLFFLVLQ